MMAETATEHKHPQNMTKRIWMVFWILAVVTSIEVFLGITHPAFLKNHDLWNMHILNWIFIGLTVLKAYYITWTFMHMEQETSSFRRVVVWSVFFYVAYIVFIFLAEGDYIYEMLHNSIVAWDF